MYLMCRLCFADEGTLELIFGIEKSLITTINDNLFEEVEKLRKFEMSKYKKTILNSLIIFTVKRH